MKMFLFLLLFSLNSFSQIVLPSGSGGGTASLPLSSGSLGISGTLTVSAGQWVKYTCSADITTCSTWGTLTAFNPFVNTISGELYAGDVLQTGTASSTVCTAGTTQFTNRANVTIKSRTYSLGYFYAQMTSAGTGSVSINPFCIYSVYSL